MTNNFNNFIVLILFLCQELNLVFTKIGKKDKTFIDYANDADDDDDRNKGIEQLIKHSMLNRTKLLVGYDLVTRQITVNIKQFETYEDMSVFNFPIMEEVSNAQFTFQTEDVLMNSVGRCVPKDVIINIKRGSYPAVNPDNYAFPKHFISPTSREQIHTIKMLSNGQIREYSITNPKPGTWFALVYIKWEDPKTKDIEQKGLSPECNRILYTHLQVKQERNIELVDCFKGLEVNYINLPAVFKCMTLDSTDPMVLNITITNTTTKSNTILFRVQALTFPSENECLLNCAFDPKVNNKQSIFFSPNPSAWHYFDLDHTTKRTNYADCNFFYQRTELEELKGNHTILNLMRDDKGRFFTFEYGLPKPDILDTSSLINITTDELKTTRFQINQFIDVGGNLVIKANLLMNAGYEMTTTKSNYLDSTHRNSFLKTVICVGIGYASVPLKTGNCKFNNNITPALLVLDTKNTEPFTSIIPYPDSGTWYLTLRLFCEDDNVVFNGRKHYLHYKASDKHTKDNIMSNDVSKFIRNGIITREATVVLSVSSRSCLDKECNDNGDCIFTSKDMAISFCMCDRGYGGWDCSDTSRMDSRFYMFCAMLFLTLSNILFLITIYVAIIRFYFTEAMMYTFTMFFSTFYHACDAHQIIAMCLFRKEILQFSDIYCAILCFWVTLLAVSILTDQFRMLLQLFGAVLVAILAALDVHSLKTFMVPVGIGAAVLLFSWFWDYTKMHSCRYPKSYYKVHMPVGLFLVASGLICFCFLETDRNYYIVHSLWHGLIALSVAFVLPDVKREGSCNPFLPSADWFHVSLFRIFNRTPIYVTPLLVAPPPQPLVKDKLSV